METKAVTTSFHSDVSSQMRAMTKGGILPAGFGSRLTNRRVSPCVRRAILWADIPQLVNIFLSRMENSISLILSFFSRAFSTGIPAHLIPLVSD